MSIVTVHVRCSSTGVRSERRFDKGTTIADLKGKLEMITGASAGNQTLSLQDEKGATVCQLLDDAAMLGAYPVVDFYTLFVTDGDEVSSRQQFEDLSLVEKADMAEEDYDKRTDSVRAFKKKNQMGRFNPEFAAQQEAEALAKANLGADEIEAKGIEAGMRCECRVGGAKRGVVMFVGQTEFASGYWVGVKYDEPLGKNDGSVKGVKYFECADKFGHFVRPADVEVGDYPEIDDLATTDEDEM